MKSIVMQLTGRPPLLVYIYVFYKYTYKYPRFCDHIQNNQ